ncbi:hypothetical protein [Kangiella geojedonensis]|uniref:Putative conserved secreted protein n=1 Tax=Kangiella geojedonensis TaxID=914150 RepID=A0A0F6RD59_9GAMM|nr:hypothetical protein [Kangiella geojedonensis]AKE53003.1 Putative conserved secreted protein [Kangiella geojedonensis]
MHKKSMSKKRFEKRKVWTSVGSALLVTTATTGTAVQADDNAFVAPASTVAVSFAAVGEGEGEGGEGEGEGSASADLSTDNAAYLAHLGLIRGHLWVGVKLYREGHLAMAKTHMKHPEDELYTGLPSVFKARGVDGFADELSALANAVNKEQGDEAVEGAYEELLKAITNSEGMSAMTAKETLLSISQMIRTAADEYAIGVKKGEIVNVHEYQDAYGFTEIAIERLERLSDEQKKQAASDIATTKALLLELRTLWPTVNPQGNVEGDASHLYGAAARIELSALN